MCPQYIFSSSCVIAHLEFEFLYIDNSVREKLCDESVRAISKCLVKYSKSGL